MIINGILFEKVLIEKLYKCCGSDYDKAEEDIEAGRLQAIIDKDGRIYVRLRNYAAEEGNDVAIGENGILIRGEGKIRGIFGL